MALRIIGVCSVAMGALLLGSVLLTGQFSAGALSIGVGILMAVGGFVLRHLGKRVA